MNNSHSFVFWGALFHQGKQFEEPGNGNRTNHFVKLLKFKNQFNENNPMSQSRAVALSSLRWGCYILALLRNLI